MVIIISLEEGAGNSTESSMIVAYVVLAMTTMAPQFTVHGTPFVAQNGLVLELQLCAWQTLRADQTLMQPFSVC